MLAAEEKSNLFVDRFAPFFRRNPYIGIWYWSCYCIRPLSDSPIREPWSQETMALAGSAGLGLPSITLTSDLCYGADVPASQLAALQFAGPAHTEDIMMRPRDTMSARAPCRPGRGLGHPEGEPVSICRPAFTLREGDGDGSQRWSLAQKMRKLIQDTRRALNLGGRARAGRPPASAELQIASSTPYAALAVATGLRPNKALGLDGGAGLVGNRGETRTGDQTRTDVLLGARLEENSEKELPASAYFLTSDSAASHQNTHRAAETSWSQPVQDMSPSRQPEHMAGDLEKSSEKPIGAHNGNEEMRNRILSAFRERQRERVQRERVLYSFYGDNAGAESPAKQRTVRSSRDFLKASKGVASESRSQLSAVSMSEIKSHRAMGDSQIGASNAADTNTQDPRRDASSSKSHQTPRVVYRGASGKEDNYEGKQGQEARGSTERSEGGGKRPLRPVDETRYLRLGFTSAKPGVSVVAEYRLSHSARFAWA